MSHRGHDCLLVPFSSKVAMVSRPGLGTVSAARHMCELVHGAAQDGMVARHLCGNGHMSCVNPRHLAWGTDAQNRHDYKLHTARPHFWPDIDRTHLAEIHGSEAPDNVVAIAYDIPASLIRAIREGRCPGHMRRESFD
jgi:hypothetical protein